MIDNFKINIDKISVINNFASENDFYSETDEKFEHNLNIKAKKIIFVGRLSREKGIDILLKAFEEILSQNINACLILVGDGEERELVESYLRENNSKIFLIKPNLRIKKFYETADVVVLPSRVDPFPLVMLEAGLMKKPFIGSNVDGISEVIEENINGLLVKPENINDLAEAISFLLNNESKAKELGENLYKKVTSEFSPEIIIPKYEALYNSLVND